MNKDAILATVIGFGIGLLIMGAVLVGPSIAMSLPALKLPTFTLPSFSLPKATRNTSNTPKPTPLAKPLTIDSPLSDSIEQNASVLVSGSTYPNATVVIEGEDDPSVVVANEKGSYAGKLSLLEGKNTITVTSYDNGHSYVQEINVFYTPEEF